MDSKTIALINGNKTITNYMGVLTDDGLKTTKHFGSKRLLYNESLDWSMPVVRKIVSDFNWEFQLTIGVNYSSAKFMKDDTGVQSVYWSTPELAVYSLIVDFLNYKSNEKS